LDFQGNGPPAYREHKDRDRRVQSAVSAIQAILPVALYPAHKRELLSVCIWKITEADGKFNTRYWSVGAISNPAEKRQHEHVHERKELIGRLLAGEDVLSVMTDAVGCIVTAQEHAALGRSSRSGWDRYKEAGIRVFDAKAREWCW